jgi:HlyD family secretion protein
MKKMPITAAAIVIPVLAASVWFYRRAEAAQAPEFRFAAVERGSVQSTVSATGTLSAVRTVQVGTQVSGQLSAIYADFNSKVKKGQLLARIDPTLQQQAVQDAQAGLERAQAQLAQAKAEYDRNKMLHDQKIVTDIEFNTAVSNNAVGLANVKSAQVALDRARQNLAYTNIYAPIDGSVVERNVDVGQTVAASLSAPQLFLIANDLSQMQILASVDESDIGQIREGQPVTFSVQSFANQSFTGTVRQVRLQSKLTDNVVNYTAVVEVANPGEKLLPGMTATVQFVTGSAADVTTVPNAALRFRPTPEMLAQAGITTGANGGATTGDSARSTTVRLRTATAGAVAGGSSVAGGATRGQRTARTNAGTIWYLDAKGKLARTRVKTGMTDGQKTEISGANVTPGMQVIIGSAQATTAATSSAPAASPLAPQGGGRRPGGF